ncbi:MAG: dinitrogenase iron-molybdenum cofactor biosynthesis protein [Thermus sp.]|uniref:NifB/NifX family molybdenum-iron cluster-binding protein n=1 Tax=Thermus sp. TaxID=275 RepID=UPI0025EA485A|nr:NifB/NifX family molybdenum-iron cluster-binding protein [Thermus sp.]MCS6868466.1 dinitrogenase iron-molybdenum cofactor biosynthesis protein [Thermus sp.]MCS7217445.1 dinitrogenase iron-molybdenum cofactor biosynthesis protein [Thermus sp.]MCX7848790.1 dinitrogenase iron-molybdenum cofactor biosynthesis protein [Thermus sp.]MDW8016682.1 NifB/NifX family molybdenum-iron cluster-binding protein [Thermus sp.]MDW8358136.1 NifB/NifX family molybdenum-iron cluster-binding protein [Thermus sp.]
MRLAIALAKHDEGKVYPGPFGHAPRFAIYELAEDGTFLLVEVRENPYAALEGGDKHQRMRELLKDVDLRVGARFGHGGSMGAFPMADRLEVGPVSLAEALERVKARRNTA